MPSVSQEEWEIRIAKLELQPGDILVIKSDRDPSHNDVPGTLVMPGVRILYIPTDVDLSVLTAAEIEARTKAA